MIDFNAPFYSAQNIFVEIHCEGEEKRACAVLAKPLPIDACHVAFFAYILHNFDTTDDGEKKPSHYHLLLMTDKKQGKKKWLEDLHQVFLFLPLEAITISPVQSERACVRYLTHIDYPNKYQYTRDLIISSNQKRVDKAFEELKNPNPSWEEICSCTSEEDVYRLVGLSNYSKCKQAWKDTEASKQRDIELDVLRQENREVRNNIRVRFIRKLDELYPSSLRANDKKSERDYLAWLFALDEIIGD